MFLYLFFFIFQFTLVLLYIWHQSLKSYTVLFQYCFFCTIFSLKPTYSRTPYILNIIQCSLMDFGKPRAKSVHIRKNRTSYYHRVKEWINTFVILWIDFFNELQENVEWRSSKGCIRRLQEGIRCFSIISDLLPKHEIYRSTFMNMYQLSTNFIELQQTPVTLHVTSSAHKDLIAEQIS